MNLNDWRALKASGEEAQLPSGLVVTVRRVGLVDLAAQGKIPQTLQPQIDEITAASKAGQTPSVSKVGEMTGILDIVCRACVLGPEGLDVAELDFTDKMAIFSWANEVAAGLKTFRGQPVGAVGVGQYFEEVRPAPVNGVGSVG